MIKKLRKKNPRSWGFLRLSEIASLESCIIFNSILYFFIYPQEVADADI